jgi:hypothetical protein
MCANDIRLRHLGQDGSAVIRDSTGRRGPGIVPPSAAFCEYARRSAIAFLGRRIQYRFRVGDKQISYAVRRMNQFAAVHLNGRGAASTKIVTALIRFAQAFWGRIVRHTRYDNAMGLLECDSCNGHRSRRRYRIFSLSRGRAKCPRIWLPTRRRHCRFALDDAQLFYKRIVVRQVLQEIAHVANFDCSR